MIRPLFVLALATSWASAQEVLWQVEGVQDVIWRGGAVFVGDLDGDGYEDLGTAYAEDVPGLRFRPRETRTGAVSHRTPVHV